MDAEYASMTALMCSGLTGSLETALGLLKSSSKSHDCIFALSLIARLNLTWRLPSKWCDCAVKPGERDTKSEFRAVCIHSISAQLTGLRVRQKPQQQRVASLEDQKTLASSFKSVSVTAQRMFYIKRNTYEAHGPLYLCT